MMKLEMGGGDSELGLLKFILELVKAGAWPFVVALLAMSFRAEIREILRRGFKAKLGEHVLDFSAGETIARISLATVGLTQKPAAEDPTAEAGGDPLTEGEEDLPRGQEEPEAERDGGAYIFGPGPYELAFDQHWRRVFVALLRAARKTGLSSQNRTPALIRSLKNGGAMSPELARVVRAARQMRMDVKAGRLPDVTNHTATLYGETVNLIVHRIDEEAKAWIAETKSGSQ
jgi:hypothetical protein